MMEKAADDRLPARLREEPFASLAPEERAALGATFVKQRMALERWKGLFDPTDEPALIFTAPEPTRD